MRIEPAIVLHEVTKRFGEKTAVDRASYDIPRGSICGIVGPNGAGKTTCIRMLLGLERATSGTLQVLGMDPWTHTLEVKTRIGYVPERHEMYGWMRGREILALAADLYPGWSESESKRVSEMLGLPLDRKVKQLSRGELAKLALTVALSHSPELLILDEPTSGLDPLIRRDFLRAIIDLIQFQPERTVFFSSHILSDIEQVADRVVVLDRGQVVAQDTLEGLCSKYLQISFVFDEPPNVLLEVPKALRVERGVREWVCVLPQLAPTEIEEIRTAIGAKDALQQPMSFEDVFLELMGEGEERACVPT